MLERTIKESWNLSDVEELRSRLNSLGKANVRFYEQCKAWVEKSEEGKLAVAASGKEAVVDEPESMPFGLGDYGYDFKMDKALSTLGEEDLYSKVTCSVCSDIPRSPKMTDVSLPTSLYLHP